jgi:hypothetical protein
MQKDRGGGSSQQVRLSLSNVKGGGCEMNPRSTGIFFGLALALFAATGVVLADPSAGWAAPLPPCPVATVSTYSAPGFACTVTDKVFSSFSLGGYGASSTVTPITTPFNPGLMFTFSPALSSDLSFVPQGFFTISTASGAASIQGASVSLQGVNEANSGGGSLYSQVLYTDNFGIPFCFGCVGNLGFLTATDTNTSVSGPFAPEARACCAAPPAGVSTLDVEADIFLFNGQSGSVSLGGQTLTFSELPEPATLTLLTPGLFGLVWLTRRRRA